MDLQLHQAIRYHERFSAEFYRTPNIPEDYKRRKWHIDNLQPLERDMNLPTEVVWDIVRRWHLMRFLFDCYCDETISTLFMSSTLLTSFAPEYPQPDTEIDPQEFDLSSFQNLATCVRGSTPGREKVTYPRFYKALTTHWLSIESLWQVKTQVWPDGEEFEDAFNSARDKCINNPQRPLQDKIDIVEIVDFVWCFLGKKAFQPSSIQSWFEDEDINEHYDVRWETEFQIWSIITDRITQLLRPPHIIELIHSSLNPLSDFNRPAFLRSLGFFDSWDGLILSPEDPDVETVETDFPVNMVDYDVKSSLIMNGEASEWWQWYRVDIWPSKMRGKVFLMSAEEVLVELSRSAEVFTLHQKNRLLMSSYRGSQGAIV
jgi:hypothetical protein